MDLVRRFTPDLVDRALAEWQWLPDLVGKQPMATSAFGDVFLRANDGVWFLDTVEGTLTREWDSPEALQAQLNTADGQDRFLLAGLATAAFATGLAPDESEVLGFKIAPVLGGAFEPENVEVIDLVVSLSIAGQVHRQVKDLPRGTSIAGFAVGGDEQ